MLSNEANVIVVVYRNEKYTQAIENPSDEAEVMVVVYGNEKYTSKDEPEST